MKNSRKNIKRLIRCFNRLGYDGCKVLKSLLASMEQYHENLDDAEAYTVLKNNSQFYLWTSGYVYILRAMLSGYKIMVVPTSPLPWITQDKAL